MSKIDFDNELELEDFVFENLDKYFSDDRIFIREKKKISTKEGKGALPDGIVIDIENSKINFIEIELINHGVFDHIGAQILRFLVAYKNEETKKKIRRLFFNKIKEEKEKYYKIFEKYDVNELEIFEKIEDITDEDPDLYIFIDKIDEDLKDMCLILKNSVDVKAIEVLKSKVKDQINYVFNDEEYTFSREESEPIKEMGTREKYPLLFNNLIENFKKKKPGSTKRGSSKDALLTISIGITDFHLEWSFVGREPEKKLEIGLHLEKHEADINHRIFDFFYTKEKEIKTIFNDDEVIFEKNWIKEGTWSRIYIVRDVGTLDEFISSNELNKWALENMVKFYDFYMKFSEEVMSLIIDY